ncbi:acetoin utilization protein AcuC [Paenibacillus thalictri]|uniref:Acetoin utilization protein AcuC n=1 Tax=Paenibacillus thalictri TaxID=2527873 RepID=A0A4Q9DT67_9BACL|nr:acetoin utilization protein AcuC [Paenibacillus thalictri]TBL78294.1 acetoin utilization protein AcuC [Paenibacillus thalictri]
MMKKPLFIYDGQETTYKFNDDHPFNQKRLVMTVDLLQRVGALPESAVMAPVAAAETQLLRIHGDAYVQAVKALSSPSPDPLWIAQAGKFGLDTEDTPFFPNMHEATSLVVGGSIAAAEAVMSGRTDHALHLGGGLHHAMQSKGSGFCVYNDAAAAIAHIHDKYDVRVLYVDTDVHHGDGVQWLFYSEPKVCTFSIHETGKYLFPGTGSVAERGEGTAFGTSINMPVEPYTEDASWLDCFDEMLERVVRHFKPDIIVSQHGCDAHALDPLAHIHCSMDIYKAMPAAIHRLAHEHCGGRWVALGGGGYDIWRVVPRAWSLLWLEMNNDPMIARLSSDPQLQLPADWLERWQSESPVPLPATWLDDKNAWTPMPRRQVITETNNQIKEVALLYVK